MGMFDYVIIEDDDLADGIVNPDKTYKYQTKAMPYDQRIMRTFVVRDKKLYVRIFETVPDPDTPPFIFNNQEFYHDKVIDSQDIVQPNANGTLELRHFNGNNNFDYSIVYFIDNGEITRRHYQEGDAFWLEELRAPDLVKPNHWHNIRVEAVNFVTPEHIDYIDYNEYVPPGTKGTVNKAHSNGEIDVTWDNGKVLPIKLQDQFRVLSREEKIDEEEHAVNEVLKYSW